MIIVDIKTALDRYLTHSPTRILDRQRPSSNFFCCYAGRSNGTPRAKNATGRARATEKRTAAHNKNLHHPHMDNPQAGDTQIQMIKC